MRNRIVYRGRTWNRRNMKGKEDKEDIKRT